MDRSNGEALGLQTNIVTTNTCGWDENGQKNSISTSVSIFFDGNGSGFENGIGICGHTETDKYGWRAEKLN
jgi:hypothetical protein